MLSSGATTGAKPRADRRSAVIEAPGWVLVTRTGVIALTRHRRPRRSIEEDVPRGIRSQLIAERPAQDFRLPCGGLDLALEQERSVFARYQTGEDETAIRQQAGVTAN